MKFIGRSRKPPEGGLGNGLSSPYSGDLLKIYMESALYCRFPLELCRFLHTNFTAHFL